MEYKLKSVALHITNECSAKCPMCYYAQEGQIKCEGKLEVLKRIAIELKNAGVEEINLVGGDPAEYSKIEELVKYLHELGFRVPILSNTHNYKNSSIERIAPYISSLEGTFHAPTAEEHNRFNYTVNSYQMMIENLKKYAEIKDKSQQIGAVLNVMNHNYNHLYEIIVNLLKEGLELDYVLIQRIGLYGRAANSENMALLREKLGIAFAEIERINKELGIESLMVDAFPLCLIPEKYHQYSGACEWGTTTASLDMNGNIVRCAVADHKETNLLGNILETPITEIWQNNATLISFRNKDYLGEECQKCDKLSICGGGCPMSCGNNILSPDVLLRTRKQSSH